MREKFLHFIWKYKKFQLFNLKTTCGKPIEILSTGTHNHDAGPDFFNAKIRIEDQLWVGNIEIHIKASDWYKHGHDVDRTFDSLILHVVYNNDLKVYRSNNLAIPSLELKGYISDRLLNTYHNLLAKDKQFIACERDFSLVDEFQVNTWLERLFIERLEDKVCHIENTLKRLNNDWESTLFRCLAKGFGLRINSDAFISMAQSIEFSVIRKLKTDQTSLEALFLGQSGLLETNLNTPYFQKLKAVFGYQKIKYQLSNETVITPKFLRLRPPGFPTLRLSQLATLYHEQEHLCSKVISLKTISEFYDLFSVSSSSFWNTHYTFEKESKSKPKTVTNTFINLLLINIVLPFKLCYAKHHNLAEEDVIIALATAMKSENNTIISKYNALRKVSQNAMHSQGLLQLHSKYCKQLRCLECSIGNSLLSH